MKKKLFCSRNIIKFSQREMWQGFIREPLHFRVHIAAKGLIFLCSFAQPNFKPFRSTQLIFRCFACKQIFEFPMQQGTLSKLDWFITKHNRLIELKKRKRMKLKLSLKKKQTFIEKDFWCVSYLWHTVYTIPFSGSDMYCELEMHRNLPFPCYGATVTIFAKEIMTKRGYSYFTRPIDDWRFRC